MRKFTTGVGLAWHAKAQISKCECFSGQKERATPEVLPIDKKTERGKKIWLNKQSLKSWEKTNGKRQRL